MDTCRVNYNTMNKGYLPASCLNNGSSCEPTNSASKKGVILAVAAAAIVVVSAVAVSYYKEDIANCFATNSETAPVCTTLTDGYNGVSNFVAPKWTATTEAMASAWSTASTALSDAASSVGGMFTNATVVEVPVEPATPAA